ncbi:hypothetical protein BDQ17DRAFT_1427985 [Cyathus striatus]|nr:hypothetical protein BDQ17DRAFT_1427985 [Cyathus striatus]
MRLNLFTATAATLLLSTTALAAPLPKTGRKVDIWTPAKNMIARLPSLFNFRREPEHEDIFGARDLEDTQYLAVRDLPPSVLRSEIPQARREMEELEDVVYRSPEDIEARELTEFIETTLNRRTWA